MGQSFLPLTLSQGMCHMHLRYSSQCAYWMSHSYINVFKARVAKKQNPFKPLLHLIPFPLTVAFQVLWLNAPTFRQSAIINSPLFVPFLSAWGLQFAHQVGRMILAHVTKQPFPMGDMLWLWSLLGAIDANIPLLLNRWVLYFKSVWIGSDTMGSRSRPPLVQHSMHNIGVIVFLTLGISVISYARFCTLVINDITNYLGIACFTVRKKDLSGMWRRAGSVDKMMVGKRQ